MADKIGFDGLTLHGVPLVFDEPPDEHGGYIVFMTREQFMAARAAGIDVHWLRPDDGDRRAFYLVPDKPAEPEFYG